MTNETIFCKIVEQYFTLIAFILCLESHFCSPHISTNEKTFQKKYSLHVCIFSCIHIITQSFMKNSVNPPVPTFFFYLFWELGKHAKCALISLSTSPIHQFSLQKKVNHARKKTCPTSRKTLEKLKKQTKNTKQLSFQKIQSKMY